MSPYASGDLIRFLIYLFSGVDEAAKTY